MHLHTQVEAYILNRITSGELREGDMIEPETVLAEKFGASRPTVRQALNKLVVAGYLFRIKGKGSFVTQPKLSHNYTKFISSYRQEADQRNQTLITRVVHFSEMRANVRLAEFLRIPPGEFVYHLTRVRYLEGYQNDRPVVYTTVYIPKRLFPSLCDYQFETASLYDILSANRLTIQRSNRTLEVIIPEKSISSALEISPFEPVIFIVSHSELSDGQVIEYAESYYPAGSSKFLIEINQ